MAVPKRKTTPSKRGMRCSHDAMVRQNIVEDSVTGELKRSHHISLQDGFYKGRQVIVTRRWLRDNRAAAEQDA